MALTVLDHLLPCIEPDLSSMMYMSSGTGSAFCVTAWQALASLSAPSPVPASMFSPPPPPLAPLPVAADPPPLPPAAVAPPSPPATPPPSSAALHARGSAMAAQTVQKAIPTTRFAMSFSCAKSTLAEHILRPA